MRELTSEEVRVLGCLVEKAATTPDNYPLSTNAVVAACNQTTNRDPVVHYTERQVDQVMIALREAGLARTVRGDGQRVHKHRHVAGEALGVRPDELAVLAVLMLRGAQTVSELRTRTERYGVALDLTGVERVLADLAGREEPLVRRLDRRAGEREARFVHLLGGAAAADALAGAPSARAVPVTGGADRSAWADASIATELEELRAQVAVLTRRFETLLERLGENVQ